MPTKRKTTPRKKRSTKRKSPAASTKVRYVIVSRTKRASPIRRVSSQKAYGPAILKSVYAYGESKPKYVEYKPKRAGTRLTISGLKRGRARLGPVRAIRAKSKAPPRFNTAYKKFYGAPMKRIAGLPRSKSVTVVNAGLGRASYYGVPKAVVMNNGLGRASYY